MAYLATYSNENYAVDEYSPKTMQISFLTEHSHATFELGSWAKQVSKTESEM